MDDKFIKTIINFKKEISLVNTQIYIIFVLLCGIMIFIFNIRYLFLTGRYKCTDKRTSEGAKMALPMLRGCYRVPSTFSFTRLFLSEGIILNRCAKTRLPSSPHAAVTAAVRPYSSDPGGQKQHQKMMVLGIPNPFILFRTKIYFFLIRAYFDKEFSIQEFTEGAKQVCKYLNICRRCC